MDGELQDGWRRVLLGTVARVETGGTPSRSRPEYWGGDVRWMSSGEVRAGRVFDTAERITDAGLRSSNAKVFQPGTVMVAMNGQGRTRGSVAFLEVEAACNQSLAAIGPGPQLSARFLYQNLAMRYDELRDLTGDDARSGLNLGLIRQLWLSLPPLCEQERIGATLDALDDAIEKTEAAIAATEELRKALLQELLTRGVPGWHSGWKIVPGIGTIPACWETVSVEALAKFTSGVGKRTGEVSPHPGEGHVPVYGGNGVTGYAGAALTREPVVVIGRVGAKCGVVHLTPGPAWITDNALYSRQVSGDVHVAFLALVLSRAGLNLRRTGNAQPLVTQSIVGAVQVSRPPKPEQSRILALDASMRDTERTLRAEGEALRSLKALVADALLSGRVRVGVAADA